MPHGNHDKGYKKWKSRRNPNSRETRNVPSKRWSEGQTRKETHHHGKLLRGTQLHETLENQNDHIMVKIHLHGEKETVTINAMIDSGATEDFIDQEVCNKHGIKMIRAKKPREIYLADGKPSAMGPVTHMTKVPMDISSHRELATLQVANLQNHEVILGMPWLRKHNPTIDWNDKRSHSTTND